MAIIARSITPSKWEKRGERVFQRVPLDGVSVDLRTSHHVLSFWMCDPSNATSVDEIALVTAASRTNIQKLMLLFLDENEVRQAKIKIAATPGKTAVVGLADRHRDLTEMSLTSFSKLARAMARAFQANEFRLYTEAKVIDLLQEAINAGKLAKGDLEKSIRDRL